MQCTTLPPANHPFPLITEASTIYASPANWLCSSGSNSSSLYPRDWQFLGARESWVLALTLSFPLVFVSIRRSIIEEEEGKMEGNTAVAAASAGSLISLFHWLEFAPSLIPLLLIISIYALPASERTNERVPFAWDFTAWFSSPSFFRQLSVLSVSTFNWNTTKLPGWLVSRGEGS